MAGRIRLVLEGSGDEDVVGRLFVSADKQLMYEERPSVFPRLRRRRVVVKAFKSFTDKGVSFAESVAGSAQIAAMCQSTKSP